MVSLRDSLVQELLRYATPDLTRRHFDESGEESIPYKETPSGLIHFKETPTGIQTVQLTNFVAHIICDTEEDDGTDIRRVLTIEARVGDTIRTFDITIPRFQSMQWPLEFLGTHAIIHPGRESHTRAAIQMLSKNVESRRVITHTGWREMDGEYVFLHAGGAVGASGTYSDIAVSLHGDLSKFLLPEPPVGAELQDSVLASIGLLKVGPPRVMYALLAAVYRAPLGEVDFTLWNGGISGAGKTVAGALAQAHFGASFTYRNAPANWSSTDNALEALAHAAKDVLLLIDDYAPTDRQERDRLNRKVDRVIRAQGNHSGRQRQNADGSLRATKAPRGMIVSTGEDVPPGKSLRGRLMVTQIDRQGANSLNWNEISRAQKEASEGKYAAAMAGYVRWLAAHYTEIREHLPLQISTLRNLALRSHAHARTPENAANLGLGFVYFLRFALESDAVTEGEAIRLLREGWAAIGELASEQVQYQDASDPVRMFVDFLSSALATGRAHVAARDDGSAPPDANVWGWREVGREWNGYGQKIGWLDGDDLYLEPITARAVVQELAARTDQQFVISSTQLFQQLNSKGLLLTSDHKTKRQMYPIRRVCEGKQQLVLHASASLFGSGSAEKPDKPDILGANTEAAGFNDVGYLESLVKFGALCDTSRRCDVGRRIGVSGERLKPDINKPSNNSNNGPNVGDVEDTEQASILKTKVVSAGEPEASEREVIEI